jgi:hypothetical protein
METHRGSKFWMKDHGNSMTQSMAYGIPEERLTYASKADAELAADEFRAKNARAIERDKRRRPENRTKPETFTVVEVTEVRQ